MPKKALDVSEGKKPKTRGQVWAIWAFGVVHAVVGLFLTVGGLLLLTEGGSPYYLVAGIAELVIAVMCFKRWGWNFVLYSFLLMGTLAWALWEVGLDGWALAPRLLGPMVLGLLMLPLPVHRICGPPSRWWIGGPSLAIVATLALAGGLAVRDDFGGSPAPFAQAGPSSPEDWRHWGQSVAGTRHAAATQINTGNVDRLKLAWRFDSDVPPQMYVSFEGTPLAADGRLYVCLQPGIVAAIDQDNGKQIWRFTAPGYAKADFVPVFGGKCRGVSYYETPQPAASCAKRVIFATPDGYLRAVDAANGKPCQSFGEGGAVDMQAGFEGSLGKSREVVMAMPSSPAAIINGVAVIGQTVSDLASLDAPSGVIRGYDAETGALKWAWDAEQPNDPARKPGEPYRRATPNAWGAIGGDEQLGLAFVPLGNSPPDYFGGMRPEALDRFTTSVAAIDVATGKLRWSFQTVHHDLWDYDLAAQPVSVDLPGKDGDVPALLVPTKLGQIFVLDRRSGRPIDRVIEKPVPQGGVPGERTAPTQPFTTGFPSLAGPDLSETMMWGITPLDQMLCRLAFRKAKYEGKFTPVGTRNTIMYPGTAGGINWGSVTIDRTRGLVVVNALRFANFGKLIPRKDAPPGGFGGAEGTAVFEQAGTPYIFAQSTFMSPLGVPCQQPPYGTISAFDLKTRKLVWSKSLGTSAKSGPFGIPTLLPIRMGVPNMGGSISTGGGLTFIAAAQDRVLRAIETATGRELWQAPLPAVGVATPMSYVSAKTGRQYVVIAAGGHYGIPGPPGGALMAYALPGKDE